MLAIHLHRPITTSILTGTYIYSHAACLKGFYRSRDDPPTVCKPCPANTKMDVVAAPMCECLTGYFRNNEGLGDACPAQQSHEHVVTKCTSKQMYIYMYILYHQDFCTDHFMGHYNNDANKTLASYVYTCSFPHNRATK